MMILLAPFFLVVALWVATYYNRLNAIIYIQPSLLVEVYANHGSLRLSFIKIPHKARMFAFEYDIYEYKGYSPSVMTAIIGWPAIILSTSLEWGFRLPIWLYALLAAILPGWLFYSTTHKQKITKQPSQADCLKEAVSCNENGNPTAEQNAAEQPATATQSKSK